jgi:hypothetical protein
MIKQVTNPLLVLLLSLSFLGGTAFIQHDENQGARFAGDANCDGQVDVLDIITIANFFVGQQPEPFCFENADVNNDGVVNVLDIIGVVEIIATASLYHAFPISDAIWQTIGDNMFNEDTWSFRFGVMGDTIINGFDYHKIYRLQDTIITSSGSEYFAAIRENESRQVFVQFAGLPETMLYDFGLGPGDTIWHNIGGYPYMLDEESGLTLWEESHYSIVLDTDSIMLETGDYRKTWTFSGGEGMNTCIEGIGAISWFGLFTPLVTAFSDNGDQYQFVCFKQDETVLYLNNPYGDGCFCGVVKD